MARSAKTTTRSYTLRLSTPSGCEDRMPLWRRLFATHYAICAGAREFGEMLLNLRGGLSASLANVKDDSARNRMLRRGVRRMLALGWISVEDDHGAASHPYRVVEVQTGTPLSPELAARLLRDILSRHKSVTSAEEQNEWLEDCLPALTANIRPDAVFVNRAEAFAAWQGRHPEVAAEMPNQAMQLLFKLCGGSFVTLDIPDISASGGGGLGAQADESDSGEQKANSRSKPDDDADPSNASRGIFGDLFGGDAEEKLERAGKKDDFGLKLREFLTGLGGNAPTVEQIRKFRSDNDLADLDVSRTEKFPAEVSSSGAPTAVAKRYRKLLVSLELWSVSADEDGVPRRSAVEEYAKVLGGSAPKPAINALDLLEVCPELHSERDDSRVFKPVWAQGVLERLSVATGMPQGVAALTEFKRLMFALAARRISQTQSWVKINELERHKAAEKANEASQWLNLNDASGQARSWLAEYERRRGEQSGSLSEFRITRRMIGECEAVFKKWQGTSPGEQRWQAVTIVQAASDKFGDAAFYTDLCADPSAMAIWGNSQGAELLKRWVALRQANYDQMRFKIPRFCHPDAFRHPTWCEFGGSSKPQVWYSWQPGSRPKGSSKTPNEDGNRRLWLRLPTEASRSADDAPLRWRSKRLARDLGSGSESLEKPIARADRAGLAAARLPRQSLTGEHIRYRPAYPFSVDAKGWNARLQLSRDELLLLEKQWDREARDWRDHGKALRHARWFVNFSPTLAVNEAQGKKIHSKLGFNEGPYGEINRKEKRSAKSQLILSRLPGLRVLSVDLGHRFAAACVVWETLTTAQMTEACRAAGRAEPVEGDLYLHLKTKRPAKAADAADGEREITSIYRRIGADFLPDGTPHPAPWARLDRQFMIKLPGEEAPARLAAAGDTVGSGPNEVAEFCGFARRLGLRQDEIRGRKRRVDELMAEAMKMARLGLIRHGRRAKIAYALDPQTRTIPGMGGTEVPFTPGDTAHINLLTDALLDWHSLASDAKWDDADARDLWNQYVADKDSSLRVESPEPTVPEAELTQEALRTKLEPIARALAAADRVKLHENWSHRWHQHDGPTDTALSPKAGLASDAKAPVVHWRAELRWLTDWIMGRKLKGSTDDAWKQNVGGISLTRISTMRSLYQLHKAYAMRPTPARPRGAPNRDESNRGIAQGILHAMESMREQRVKLLASRIATAALGLGGHWKQVQRHDGNGQVRTAPQGAPLIKAVWVEDQEPRYAICHAVVIENLKNYRPDEMQTRRENRQLMQWSSSKVEKYLSEACELHGLHLRAVRPDYTSRQDSRTGAPGVRCALVPVADFISSPWWRKQVSAAKQHTQGKQSKARERYLTALDKLHQSRCAEEECKALPPLVIPQRGGDFFVTASACTCCQKSPKGQFPVLQADLNAAANIGLRALMDPDWPGRWWYIPCDAATGVPDAETITGSRAIAVGSVLPGVVEPKASDEAGSASQDANTLSPEANRPSRKGKKRRGAAQSDRPKNFWRDITGDGVTNASHVWKYTTEYWNAVEFNVIRRLEEANCR